MTDEAMEQLLDESIENIRREQSFLSTLPVESIHNLIFITLLFHTICTKHFGFLEELEWRLICVPDLLGKSDHIERLAMTIRGVPQVAYKLPFEDQPENNLVGFSLPDLIDHIIIGPTQFPYPAYEAFVHALDKIGVKDAANKVFCSNIPLRT